MEILLNPNVAYLMLVAGFSLAIMSVLAPGTGLLEIGALFALILAGWSVYHLPVNLWALGVLALGVFPFLLAVRKSRQLGYLAIAILALVAGSAFLFRGEGWLPAVNPLLALLTSILVAGYFWLAATKTLEAERAQPAHDLAALLGSTGEARTPIEAEGSVHIRGELWSAQSDQPIPEGAQVRVVGREGLTLIVEKV